MTKDEALKIEGLSELEKNVISQAYFAERNTGNQGRFSKCATEEEVKEQLKEVLTPDYQYKYYINHLKKYIKDNCTKDSKDEELLNVCRLLKATEKFISKGYSVEIMINVLKKGYSEEVQKENNRKIEELKKANKEAQTMELDF